MYLVSTTLPRDRWNTFQDLKRFQNLLSVNYIDDKICHFPASFNPPCRDYETVNVQCSCSYRVHVCPAMSTMPDLSHQLCTVAASIQPQEIFRTHGQEMIVNSCNYRHPSCELACPWRSSTVGYSRPNNLCRPALNYPNELQYFMFHEFIENQSVYCAVCHMCIGRDEVPAYKSGYGS